MSDRQLWSIFVADGDMGITGKYFDAGNGTFGDSNRDTRLSVVCLQKPGALPRPRPQLQVIQDPRFGKAYKSPDGFIWSQYQGRFTNDGTVSTPNNQLGTTGIVTDSAATRACAKIGGVLPTVEDFKKFLSYFALNGTGEFSFEAEEHYFELFPELQNADIWTSNFTNHGFGEYYTTVFTAQGKFEARANTQSLPVICVRRP